MGTTAKPKAWTFTFNGVEIEFPTWGWNVEHNCMCLKHDIWFSDEKGCCMLCARETFREVLLLSQQVGI